jgi:integrase
MAHEVVLMSGSQDTTGPAADQGCGDKRRLVKTKTPGVFKRINGKGRTIGYACVYRSSGKQRKRHARSYEEAKRIKRESETDRDRGELQERNTITFRRYLDEWVGRYRGQGRRGFRETTREEYRRLIGAYAHRYFPARLKLVDVSTYTLARFVDWLADEEAQGKTLGDRTIANATIPLRAALATAKCEGLIRHNPAQGLTLPPRQQVEGDEIKAFTPEQLATVIGLAPERHGLLLELLAATGLRISEAIALQRLHVQVEGPEPEVFVRHALVRGRIEPPKTKYGRREVRLPDSLAVKLRPPRRRARPSLDRDPLPERIRRPARPEQPAAARPQAARETSRSALGRLPHVPPHLRHFASVARHQPPPTEPRPRPPLARLHADSLHASAAGGGGPRARSHA